MCASLHFDHFAKFYFECTPAFHYSSTAGSADRTAIATLDEALGVRLLQGFEILASCSISFLETATKDARFF